jgi:hypothetical protein
LRHGIFSVISKPTSMSHNDNIPTPEKEDLKDDGAERAREGKSDGVTFLQGILSSDEKNEVRNESFVHTKDVMRDAETVKKVKEEKEEEK